MLSLLAGAAAAGKREGEAAPSGAPAAKATKTDGQPLALAVVGGAGAGADAAMQSDGAGAKEGRVQRTGRRPTPKAKAAATDADTENLILKGTLNALQQLRLHHACLFQTLIGPNSSVAAVLVATKAAGDDYHKLTVGKTGHGLGGPQGYRDQAGRAPAQISGELMSIVERLTVD